MNIEEIVRATVRETLAQLGHADSSVGRRAGSTSDALLTRRQVAAALKISLTTLNTHLHSGKIPFERIGRRVLIPRWYVDSLSSSDNAGVGGVR